MKALVFGSNGGIGSCVSRQLTQQGHRVVDVNRAELDCSDNDLEQHVSDIISNTEPDWIFNCVGILGDNQSDYRSVFDANFGLAWAIVRYYIEHPDQAVKIMLTGSAVHNQPRRNLVLYAASKSALHNMWQSTEDIFAGTNVHIALVHPPRVNTAMLNGRPGASLEPEYVAQVMIDLTRTMKSRTLLELGT
jgi:NAD(P)-dependent dehydrogenase (short-subunit alcohol dehydrogenase family)